MENSFQPRPSPAAPPVTLVLSARVSRDGVVPSAIVKIVGRRGGRGWREFAGGARGGENEMSFAGWQCKGWLCARLVLSPLRDGEEVGGGFQCSPPFHLPIFQLLQRFSPLSLLSLRPCPPFSLSLVVSPTANHPSARSPSTLVQQLATPDALRRREQRDTHRGN